MRDLELFAHLPEARCILYIYIYIHTYIHTYIHIYIYVYIPARSERWRGVWGSPQSAHIYVCMAGVCMHIYMTYIAHLY